ncbi:MAG: molybdenum cofactor biosynthesis protein MoaE [Candidatus Poseidoniaceae archaeon]|nr:molybdenum cofactor biosynthesis protein MoaE [Candidatus Poseidoniaceae archaeon]
MDKRVVVKVVETELDADALQRSLTTDGCGAVVSFLGIVRDIDEGEQVIRLEFDAWKERLEPVLRQLAEESIQLHGVSSIVLGHRVGAVGPQQPIVSIHVASPHRKEAFESCSWLIDELKAQAPLWKKEVRASGQVWKAGLG